MFTPPRLHQLVEYKGRTATVTRFHALLRNGNHLVEITYTAPFMRQGELISREDVETCHLRVIETNEIPV